ncbi:hypothetical protein F2Q69_00056663 [Brassica cretica]|uniref:AT3G52170-like helix-turn-helix domain-containing protein n=1 Tax=Brassica cretica TaxID=69181 RepID=A0A8S9MWM4_BRACR|nr:hypothetical protein F2Q69_00056663 [Brassica cretica]
MAAHRDNLVLSVFPNQSYSASQDPTGIRTPSKFKKSKYAFAPEGKLKFPLAPPDSRKLVKSNLSSSSSSPSSRNQADICSRQATRLCRQEDAHRRLNNGSFPSLSLTHKEVGGSFYTIREIVREIIQENRVLGTSDLILLDAKGDGDDQLQDQSLSRSTVLMNPVPPLFLSPDGLHSRSEPVEAKSPPVGSSTDVSRTQFAAASCSEVIDAGMHDDKGETICDSLPQDKEVEVDNKDIGFEAEIHFIESEGKNPLNNNQSVKDDKAAIKDTLGTIDLLPAETVVETFSVTPSELAKVCEAGKETEAKVENDSSTEDLVEIPSSISAVLEEQGTEEVTVVAQMPNHISVTIEKKVEEKAVIGNIHDTKEFRYGSLTTEQPIMPTSGTEDRVFHDCGLRTLIIEYSRRLESFLAVLEVHSGSCKNDIARSEVTSVEKATVEKKKFDASCSQKGNIATLNQIKLESWKGQSNVAGPETNPLLVVLKAFLTAFVKFWSK